MKQGDALSLPKGWEIKKLGDVCIVERGSSPRPIKKYQTNSSDGVNWIKIGDTKGVDKYIFDTKEKITKEGAQKSRYVKEGDFILSNSMSFGKPYIMKTDGYIHDGWFVFRLPDYLDKDYFFYLLISPIVQGQIQSLGAGAIVKNISGDLVKKVDVTYPKSLPEQKRIVAILDKAFEAIEKAKANAEKNLKNAKELFESYLNEVFENKGDDWEENYLDNITTKIGSGATPRGGKKSYKTRGISLVRSMNVYDLNFREKNLAFIDESQASALSNVTLNRNDILLNITGASIARCCIIPEKYLPARVNQHVSIIRMKSNEVAPKFINFLLVSKFYKDQLLLTGEQGATRQAITKIQIENFRVSYPSLKQQKEIAHKLTSLLVETKSLEKNYIKKLENFEELKKTLMQKAFSGEL